MLGWNTNKDNDIALLSHYDAVCLSPDYVAMIIVVMIASFSLESGLFWPDNVIGDFHYI